MIRSILVARNAKRQGCSLHHRRQRVTYNVSSDLQTSRGAIRRFARVLQMKADARAAGAAFVYGATVATNSLRSERGEELRDRYESQGVRRVFLRRGSARNRRNVSDRVPVPPGAIWGLCGCCWAGLGDARRALLHPRLGSVAIVA